VVVTVGLTACVPPFGDKVEALPSVPAMVTWVAFVAVTVSVDELPLVIDVGLAEMVTEGAVTGVTVTIAVAEVFPPGPVAVAV